MVDPEKEDRHPQTKYSNHTKCNVLRLKQTLEMFPSYQSILLSAPAFGTSGTSGAGASFAWGQFEVSRCEGPRRDEEENVKRHGKKTLGNPAVVIMMNATLHCASCSLSWNQTGNIQSAYDPVASNVASLKGF